jgi:hypothetical protein
MRLTYNKVGADRLRCDDNRGKDREHGIIALESYRVTQIIDTAHPHIICPTVGNRETVEDIGTTGSAADGISVFIPLVRGYGVSLRSRLR